ncbi:nucleotide-diphospho-sugar transferase [Aspergillus campestris IBT 28561]|uniref:Nucleotide-diphospho-sugar transferase n=1 Tax=Aspergillus campestris (strain IBT 28561) TaxID=1392248 RepID=A0A2I1DBD3_ASPC2|nr:nucleotide-diphospho-sugar transferase [Aspergillus campestris IBT 28561]PKY07192.1 nucleotide-diphospho-sugar transferase [Aspergillus campestris IBT 28561]
MWQLPPMASPKLLRPLAVILATLLVITTLWRLRISVLEPLVPDDLPHDHAEAPSGNEETDWSRFAYVQYVTDDNYLCNSVMLFERLHSMHSKADRLLMYPDGISTAEDDTSLESKLVRKARDEYNVKLQPIQVQSRPSGDATWAESYTKLLAFNQTQYDRVLGLDSDSTILQPMDELFLLPSCPVAMPRAYWLDPNGRTMSSQLFVVEPSDFEFGRIMESISHAGGSEYDMEIFNELYKDSALIIPHRPYNLLTGEFRSESHTAYLGNSLEQWDPDRALSEAKYLHFSDWPVPKPWIKARPDVIQDKQPACQTVPEQPENCRNRDLWLGFYEDFARRRKAVCDIDV